MEKLAERKAELEAKLAKLDLDPTKKDAANILRLAVVCDSLAVDLAGLKSMLVNNVKNIFKHVVKLEAVTDVGEATTFNSRLSAVETRIGAMSMLRVRGAEDGPAQIAAFDELIQKVKALEIRIKQLEAQ